MDRQRSQQLQDIIKLSRQMLEHAQAGEWTEVADVELTRRDIVMACFARPTPRPDAEEVAAAVREILGLNQEVAVLGKSHRDALGVDVHNYKVGSAAHAAYLNCGR